MGQHQRSNCERQFACTDSLRRHLTRRICSEDIESETMSENEDSTMSDESDAESSRRHQRGYSFVIYEFKIKIMVLMMMAIMIQIILMKIMKTNIILVK